jgi:type IV pilus assembly protein PilX
MKNKTCISIMAPVNNEGGFTLILALILLMLLTIIGVAAINTSTTETMITTADEDKRTAFYAADSAVEQVTAQLNQILIDRWRVPCIMVPGTRPNWSLVLNGDSFSAASPQPAPPTPPTPQWFRRYNAGVPIASGPMAVSGSLAGYSFDARAWNNTDSLNPASPNPPEQTDTDGLLIVGVIATSPRNSRVAVEVTLNAGIDGISTVGTYTAQAGGGAGKNYNAMDVGAVSAANMGAMSNPGGVLR